jgi:DNA-binding transcriptional regulator PaaX
MKRKSATTQLLLALVPYTSENLRIVFQPGRFFTELERNSDYNRSTMQTTYYRLKRQGYVVDDEYPRLTAKGKKHIQPYVAKSLAGSELLVIFDIPQEMSDRRRRLRALLRHLGFKQRQKSVWVSSYDYKATITEAIRELRIGDWVEVYEAVQLK